MSVKQIFNTSAELDYPTVLPTLDLDFANSKTLDPRITFTRASGGSYYGADGLIEYAGVNEPRFDHDPYTGESLGFLVEESRTNIRTTSILFDSGNSAGLYGNWAYADILSNTAAITPDGTLTANRFRPTSPTASRMQRFSATAGLTYTISMYLKLDPESPSNTNVFYFGFQVAWSNNGSTLTSYASSPTLGDQLTNEWKRFSFSYTLPAGATSMEMGPSNMGQGAADPNYSVLAWGWQIEQGAFPTSYIPTEGSSRTRASDDASITGKNFSDFYNPNKMTLFADIRILHYPPDYGDASAVFGFGLGAPRINFGVGQEASRPIGAQFYDGSVDGALLAGYYEDLTINSSIKMSLSFDNGVSSSITYNNRVVNQVTASVVNLSGIASLKIGRYADTDNQLNGTISRLTYYPKRLTNQQLQSLTT